MTVDLYLARLIGYAAAYVLLALFGLVRKKMWLRRAHKLAAQSDIALPPLLDDRVARFLRAEFMYGQFLVLLVIDPLAAGFAEEIATPGLDWAVWFPMFLVGLPLILAVSIFPLTLWPRWRASREYRVTHLSRLPISQAFTPSELTAVVIGVLAVGAFGGWGLYYVAAPAVWWVASSAAMTVVWVAWYYTAAGIMRRPSSASDVIELGWDDLLRFRAVRGLTAGLAWGTATILFLVVSIMSSVFSGYQLGPFEVWIAAGVVLWLVFRQGRQRWRRAWLERDGSA